MSKKQKTHQDVLGWQMNCNWYEKCPLCYGCRAYDPKMVRCEKCAQKKKFNICDTAKHRGDLIARMIRRDVIDLDKS